MELCRRAVVNSWPAPLGTRSPIHHRLGIEYVLCISYIIEHAIDLYGEKVVSIINISI